MSEKWTGGRLKSIDALRGVAALLVLFFHATQGAERGETGRKPDSPFGLLLWVLSFGFSGVFLFFVISGFCIHLRWAKECATGVAPRLDFVEFWRRRFRRLYPPYLVTIAVFLLVLMLEGKWDPTEFNLYDLGIHLIMLHNLDPRTVYSINGVFWTLAIEEQLYLMYFLLLVLRGKLGWAKTLLCCLGGRLAWFGIGLVAYRAFGLGIPVSEGAPAHWFAWALGAVSVESALGIIELPEWCRRARFAVLWLITACVAQFACQFAGTTGLYQKAGLLVMHPLWAFGFFLALNALVASERGWKVRGSQPILVRALAFVGLFSYSLYLTHELILTHVAPQLARIMGRDGGPALLLALTPLCVTFAWVFFVGFERPFISKPHAPNPAQAMVEVEAVPL